MSSSVFAQHMGAACAPILSCAPDVGSVAHVDLEIFKSQTLLSSTWASQGRKFQNWNAWSVERSKECAYRMGASLLCSTATISWFFIPAPSFVKVGPSISSRRSFSWKLLIAPDHRSQLHPIPSRLISSHLMSFLLVSAFLSWSQLFSSLLMSSELFSSLLSSSQNSSFLSSSQLLHFRSLRQFSSSPLVSAHQRSSHVKPSQLIQPHLLSAYLSSSQILSALFISFPSHVSSSHVFSSRLSFSQLFKHLSSAQLLSALITLSQLLTSQVISVLLWPKTCSKNLQNWISVPKPH